MANPLNISVQNQTCQDTVYCYLVGLSLTNSNQLMLLSADGKTPYYPPNVTTTCVPLPQDCSIVLGKPGTSIVLQVPPIAGCRIYFCVGNKLQFFVNPGGNGPSLVEPSVTNPSDPNINFHWNFVELTSNSSQVFANISCVDFVGIPLSVSLETASGAINHVSGMPLNAINNIATALKAQQALDGQPWTNLLVHSADGSVLRILSPNQAMITQPGLFSNYFDPYVAAVWTHLATFPLSVDTQAQWGVVAGHIANGQLTIDGIPFAPPTTADIFSCSSGPFACGANAEANCIIPRLAAAFNRSTLLTSAATPDPAGPGSFYREKVTNHYARIVHEQLLDARGYAFPYDDVAASGGPDQCGAVYDGSPELLTIAVGGNGARADPACSTINC
jgi:hypothetical protein